MMRLTNIALVLITLSAAAGCSAVVNNTLEMKDDGGVGDSGVTDSGGRDSGPAFCATLPDAEGDAYCSEVPCRENGRCEPATAGADEDGCVFAGGLPNGTMCRDYLANTEDDIQFMGMCVDGFCEGCGDGDVVGGEQCDDGNRVRGDGCENDCTFTCRNDIDCAFDCAAARSCGPPPGGGLEICLPVPGAPLPMMGATCTVTNSEGVTFTGMCEYRTGGELCCGTPGPMGQSPCCGLFPGEPGLRCELVALPPP